MGKLWAGRVKDLSRSQKRRRDAKLRKSRLRRKEKGFLKKRHLLASGEEVMKKTRNHRRGIAAVKRENLFIQLGKAIQGSVSKPEDIEKQIESLSSIYGMNDHEVSILERFCYESPEETTRKQFVREAEAKARAAERAVRAAEVAQLRAEGKTPPKSRTGGGV